MKKFKPPPLDMRGQSPSMGTLKGPSPYLFSPNNSTPSLDTIRSDSVVSSEVKDALNSSFIISDSNSVNLQLDLTSLVKFIPFSRQERMDSQDASIILESYFSVLTDKLEERLNEAGLRAVIDSTIFESFRNSFKEFVANSVDVKSKSFKSKFSIDNERVIIDIQDDGPGIPGEVLKTLQNNSAVVKAMYENKTSEHSILVSASGKQADKTKAGGMGLFLKKLLNDVYAIEGNDIKFANLPDGSGSQITMSGTLPPLMFSNRAQV